MKQLANRHFFTLVRRETERFLALYKQTVMPGLISTALYILVFGKALGKKIDANGLEVDYTLYIIPGLIMMAVINHAYQNSSSSIMQAKFLKFLDDILVTPLSGLEIAFGYITGGVLRGVITGLTIIFVSTLSLINFSITKSLIFSLIISILFGISMWKAIKDLWIQVEAGTVKEIDDFF